MPLEIAWTRNALRLPEEARAEVGRRLRRLHRYFPEAKPHMRIGITRSYDGLAFQSNEGRVKLMIDVHRRQKGGWRFPTYWTLGHELMHLAQFNSSGVPSGERACDIFALARLPPSLIDDSPSYLVVPPHVRRTWNRRHARLAHDLARAAIRRRAEGARNYAVWWEEEFERRTSP